MLNKEEEILKVKDLGSIQWRRLMIPVSMDRVLSQEVSDFICFGLVRIECKGTVKIGQTLLMFVEVIKINDTQIFEYSGVTGMKLYSALEIGIRKLEFF